jgi:hypothetical protein
MQEQILELPSPPILADRTFVRIHPSLRVDGRRIGFTSLGKSRPHGGAVTLTRPIRHRGSQMCALLGAEGLPRFGWSLPLPGMSSKLSRKSHRCAGVGISAQRERLSTVKLARTLARTEASHGTEQMVFVMVSGFKYSLNH